MKTVLFTFESPVGTFWIQPQPAGRVLLGLGNRHLKTYSSPADAADAVAHKETGAAEWDDADVKRPRSLHQWKRGKRLRQKVEETEALEEIEEAFE